jgi:predicted transcriptional regulator of viral defense system
LWHFDFRLWYSGRDRHDWGVATPGTNSEGLALLDDAIAEGRETITTRWVVEHTGRSGQAASNLLTRLRKAGLLERVSAGHYVVRPFGLLGTSVASEDLATALAALFGERSHRIAYRTALDELGLISHPARTVQVASPHRVRVERLGKRRLHVIRESPETLTLGAEALRPHTWLSLPERALLDAASRPSLVGGVAVVAEALGGARVGVRLLESLARELRAEGALRRLGSLADHLGTPLAGRLRPPARPGRDLPLDPAWQGDPDQVGAWRDQRWGVRWPMTARELGARGA